MKAVFDILAKPESDDATEYYNLEVPGLGARFREEIKQASKSNRIKPADCDSLVFYEIITQSDSYDKDKQNKAKRSNIGCGCFSILAIIIMIVYASPHFLMYRCRIHKQSEAKQMLVTISKMQEKYMSERGSYADNEALGFPIKGEYYAYQIIRNSPTSYMAEAVSDNNGKGINGNAGDDVWTINEDEQLIHVKNACQ